MHLIIGSSSNNASNLILDRANPGPGFVSVLGAAGLGNNTFNFTAGSNVTSGTAGVSACLTESVRQAPLAR